ncbi:hypothetical protein [Mariprofundus ferrooxydans]|uniref:hypothetical protein n=1 Tax=Mariprofundus ferrooxydans TaxID=314344 RepID=UPI00143037D4|nr:hypothetical protein [Mariprofundus ferrooxydans]
MNIKSTNWALFALLAGTSLLMPVHVNAESRDMQHGGRGDAQNAERHSQPRVERQRSPRVERHVPTRVERQNQPRVGRQQPSRVERQVPARVERQNQPRVERQRPPRVERQRLPRTERQSLPRVERRSYDRRSAGIAAHRQHVEVRRSFYIGLPLRYDRSRHYYRVPRNRYFRGIHVYRLYGYRYPGFGFFYSDNDAFRWLALTALTLSIVDHLDEHQQRLHEQALIRATSGDIGDVSYWRDGRSFGSVTVTDIWIGNRGRECREIEQRITTGGRTETSFRTVCEKRGGVWKVMPD